MVSSDFASSKGAVLRGTSEKSVKTFQGAKVSKIVTKDIQKSAEDSNQKMNANLKIAVLMTTLTVIRTRKQQG